MSLGVGGRHSKALDSVKFQSRNDSDILKDDVEGKKKTRMLNTDVCLLILETAVYFMRETAIHTVYRMNVSI